MPTSYCRRERGPPWQHSSFQRGWSTLIDVLYCVRNCVFVWVTRLKWQRSAAFIAAIDAAAATNEKPFQGVCENGDRMTWNDLLFLFQRAVWFRLERFSSCFFPLASADPVPLSEAKQKYEGQSKVCALLCFFLHPFSLKCPSFLQSAPPPRNKNQTVPTFGQTFILLLSSLSGLQRLASFSAAPIGWSLLVPALYFSQYLSLQLSYQVWLLLC